MMHNKPILVPCEYLSVITPVIKLLFSVETNTRPSFHRHLFRRLASASNTRFDAKFQVLCRLVEK